METYKTWLAETEEFFFKGAASGWAGGHDGDILRPEDGTPGMEEWREVIYRDLIGFTGYHFVDRWGIDPDSGRPSGHMIVTHWNIPVWVMWVGGHSYPADAYPFLRDVLQRTYSKRLFCGGRGLAEVCTRDFRYTNRYEGNFSRFRGREEVEYIEADGGLRLAGYHEYWGGSLVSLPPL